MSRYSRRNPGDGAGDGGTDPAPLNPVPPGKGQPMNALIRWDPFKEMEDLQSRLTKLFGLTPARTENGGGELMTITEWAPSVDIIEDQKEWLVKADLPEVKKEELKVTVENGVLTITGERKFEKESKKENYHRIERTYGSFIRSFALPTSVDADKVSAEYKDGVLTLTLPKKEEAKAKTITVQTSKN